MCEGQWPEKSGVKQPAMTRRTYLATAGAAGVTALAAACGGTVHSTSDQSKLVKGPVQIVWTFWATADNIGFFNEMIGNFQTTFPDVKVQGIQIPGVHDDAIFAMASAGTPPDAMETARPSATGWAVKGISGALDTYLARAGFKESDYYPTAISPWKISGKQMGTWLGGACHTIAHDGKQKEAAARYLLYMAGPEGNTLLAKWAFGVPAVKSIANSEAFLKQPTRRPIRQRGSRLSTGVLVRR